MQEREGFERPSTYLRERGSFTAKGALTYAGVPASLHAWPESAPINRLGLAQWLVDPGEPARRARRRQSPLGTDLRPRPRRDQRRLRHPGRAAVTSRAARLARHRIRRSQVESEALLRLIVTSSTYARTRTSPPRSSNAIPYNRLLARGPRFRLEAETVRDAGALRQRPAQPEARTAPASSRRSRTASGTSPTTPTSGRRARARIATGAASTRSCAARRRIRR